MIINLATARKKIEIKSQHSVRDLIYCRMDGEKRTKTTQNIHFFFLNFYTIDI